MKQFLVLLLFWAAAASAADVLVRDSAELRRAIGRAEAGSRIVLAPGQYDGGMYFSNLRGESNRPIVIAAADAARPPIIRGGGNGIQLSDPAFVELHHLIFTGWSANGVSIDDAGSLDTPARGIVLRGLVVTNTGPRGNRDGIKLSGVDDFRVEHCIVAGWGIGGGSGIDMVGCHRGLIRSNAFSHTDDAGSTGVQCKGGTSEIRIQRNRFENAGGRGVNIGGSTGRAYFRPPLREPSGHAEARNIRVEGNTFVGSAAAMAFVGVDGAVVRFNTIYRPKRWALRILQETRTPDFVPSRNGEFTDNIVVFHSTQWSEGGVNIGSGTAPETFQFARNWWYCLDRPERSRPRLPSPETNGVHGRAIVFRDAPHGDFRLSESNGAGADAFKE
jgi:hypothetical protein